MTTGAKNIKFFLILLMTFFVAPAFALAVVPARLEVQFESAPLFQNANFIPFDEVSRFVKVTNNTDVSQEVIVEAIHYSSCPLIGACFAKKLHLKITSGADMYFDKPLSDFYGAGTISLGNLGAGAMKQYDFRIVFEGGLDDNDYQNSTTNFDLLAGFAGTEGSVSGGGETSGGVGGGGGGGFALLGLQINNEAVVSVSESTAAISWNTNYLAWGDVIYGIDTSTPYILNLSLPNFGYPSSAPSDPQAVLHNHTNSKSLNHLIHLSGLVPGATYRYRAVSHASPPTIGYERTFTVPLNAGENSVGGEGDGIGGSSELPDEDGLVLGAMKDGGAAVMSDTISESSSASVSDGDDEQNNIVPAKNLALAFGPFGDVGNWRWVLILLIIFILFLFWKRKKNNEGE